MKKISIIFCFFCYINISAQVADSIYVKDFRHLLDSMYAGLDSNKIPTKMLISRAPFSEKIKFANGLMNDSIHSYIEWCFYYSIMANASLHKFAIDDYLTIDSISQSIIKKNNTIPLGCLNFFYNEFKDSVVEKNLIIQNGIMSSSSSSSTFSNTYNTKKLFLITPLVFSTDIENNSFILNTQQVFTNDTNLILSYEMSNNDGVSYTQFYPNISFNFSFSTEGANKILFRVIKVNGDTLYAASSIYITNNSNTLKTASSVITPDEGPTNIFSRCYSSSTDTYGKYAIWYGCGNTSNEIRKPLIISTGVNPAKGKALVLSGLGAILYPSALPSVYDGWRGLYFETYNGVRNKFSLTGNEGDSNGLDFMKNMIGRGYDIIILQYVNDNADLSGVDYIENNACVLEELIRTVNNRKMANPVKPSYHENIVIGYSAGALGARYALTHMEQEHNANITNPYYPNHHTRTWIAVECENQGSNTPIGLQVFAKFMKEINITYSIDDAINRFLCKSSLKIFDCPIAKQNTFFHQSQLSGPMINGPHPDFNTTMNNFNALSSGPAYNMKGYPLNCRRVGISCGSGIGNFNDVDVTTPMAEYDSHTNYFNLGGFYTFGKHLTAHFIRHSQFNSIIFDYNFYFKPFLFPQMNFWIGGFPQNVHVGSPGLLDNCPGSLLAGNDQLFSYFKQNFYTRLNRSNDLPQFCPTTSALDLHDPNNGYQIANVENVTPENLQLNFINAAVKGFNHNFGYPHIKHPIDHYQITPFDAVYAIGTPDPNFRNNQFHVEDPQISQRDFLLDEIAPRHLRLSNRTIGATELYYADFEALDEITAGNNVYTTNLYTPDGDFSYEQYSGGEFRAGKQITLKAGFSAKSGTNFRAYIDPWMCDFLFREGTPNSTNARSAAFNTPLINTLERPPFASANSTLKATKVITNKPNGMLAYPNPAVSNEVTFNTNTIQNTEYQINIYNNNGQLIQTISNQVLPFTYNLKNLVAGLYNVIFTGKTENSSAKFIKE